MKLFKVFSFNNFSNIQYSIINYDQRLYVISPVPYLFYNWKFILLAVYPFSLNQPPLLRLWQPLSILCIYQLGVCLFDS